MLTAVWVAVIVAVGFWAALVCVAIVTLIRLSRLMAQTSDTVAHLRESSDVLLERGQAAVDRVDAQLARTDAITASMDEVSANMAELTGRVAALAPLARLIVSSAGGPLSRVPAFVYGVARAIGMRRTSRSTPLPGRPAGRTRGELAGQREEADL